jgi:hypothetical protein
MIDPRLIGGLEAEVSCETSPCQARPASRLAGARWGVTQPMLAVGETDRSPVLAPHSIKHISKEKSHDPQDLRP